ncbi:MAG: cell division protein FtsL [Butyrivibrio sp.]|nr:cell division protein FtsL [Butyrivibrio sp.]
MAQIRYNYGNTARSLSVPQREIEHVHVHHELSSARAKRKQHMNVFGLLVLTCALIATGVILSLYIYLQSEITNSVKHIATLESQLNTLKQDNDEAYNRANSNLDLEEIRRIAIQEYGMTYADEGQIVTYSGGDGNDYVRQVAPIPQNSGN